MHCLPTKKLKAFTWVQKERPRDGKIMQKYLEEMSQYGCCNFAAPLGTILLQKDTYCALQREDTRQSLTRGYVEKNAQGANLPFFFMQHEQLEVLWQNIKATIFPVENTSTIPCGWLNPYNLSTPIGTKSLGVQKQASCSSETTCERRRYSIENLLELSSRPYPNLPAHKTKKRKREIEEEEKQFTLPDSDVRSDDIVVKGKNSSLTFEDMFLCDALIAGLKSCGFEKPSPVQVASIPYARLGCDLIVQAKSGTGKTCVYVVTILQAILDMQKKSSSSLSSKAIQAMIIVPTRELATQVAMVFSEFKKTISDDVKVITCFGGTSLKQDSHSISKGFSVVIGTPGRINSLVDSAVLCLDHIQIFVLDEADKLFESCFSKDISAIEQRLPSFKQVLAFSATYSTTVLSKLHRIMKDARKITVLEETAVETTSFDAHLYSESSLRGITHYKAEIESMEGDIFRIQLETLFCIFGEFSFQQCLVFCNDKSILDRYCYELRKAGFSADFTSGELKQSTRNEIFRRFYTHKTQVLFTTDLLARGIDFVNCNLVVNLDIPRTGETYLHRAGRAGRFGRFGNCITLYSSTTRSDMEQLESQLGLHFEHLQIEISYQEGSKTNEGQCPMEEASNNNIDLEQTSFSRGKDKVGANSDHILLHEDSNYFYWKGYWYGYFLSQWYLWIGESPPPVEQAMQQYKEYSQFQLQQK